MIEMNRWKRTMCRFYRRAKLFGVNSTNRRRQSSLRVIKYSGVILFLIANGNMSTDEFTRFAKFDERRSGTFFFYKFNNFNK